MAKVLVSHGVPAEGFEALKEHELVIPAPLSSFSKDELKEKIVDADAVVSVGKLPGETIRLAKKLKIIANYGAGYDNVDIQAAAECGIPVTNIPETVTYDTAELAIGLMMSVSRRIGEMTVRMRQEVPESLFGVGRHLARSLRGQVLGIVGCGRIGTQTAQLAKALGMHVLGYCRKGADPAIYENVTLQELLEKSDIISLHCPLTDETRGLIGKEAFAGMKEGVMLINTARGPVVDHEALLAALKSGKVSGAGLDVFPREPHVPAELLEMPNVVCTPHIGSNTSQTRYSMAQACSKQILDVLEGKRPQNIVNGL